MPKLSSITDQILNPYDLDRVHVIHQIGGVWYSYFMSLDTLKEWVNNGATGGTGLTITELVFTIAGEQVYQAALNELIQVVTFKPTNPAHTIKVGTAADDDFYLEETVYSPWPANLHMTDPSSANRQIKVTVSGQANVKIISILNI